MAAALHVRCAVCVIAFVTPGNLAGVVPAELLSAKMDRSIDLSLDEEDFGTVLDALRTAFGDSSVSEIEQNVRQIKELMLSVFASSPKNSYGRLDDVAARYALRRVLMERHGWDLPSLAENASQHETPLVALLGFGSSLPFHVRTLLEQRVANKGAGILELSVFVAALEQTVYDDVPRQLEVVYRLMGIPVMDTVDADTAVELVHLYMGSYVMSQDLSNMSVPEALSFRGNLPLTYINWAGATRFFRHIQAPLLGELRNISFANMSSVLSKIQKEFVHFIHDQCSGVKSKLLDMEADATGRVRLVDFYKAALYKGMNEFRETIPYLKDLGVLDESDPLDPRVVVSNYLDGPSNCLASSNLYTVCCVDECANLYDHIEQIVNKPEAPPEQIVSIVKRLASPSMQRGRLSSVIVRRIHDIAKAHGGVVPLHGPDFSEWMHFAYPRECVHPKMFGPAHSQILEDWEKQTDFSAAATEDQLLTYISDLEDMEHRRTLRDDANGEDSCWTWDAAPKNFTLDGSDEDSDALDNATDLPSSQVLGSGLLRWLALLVFVVGLASSVLTHLRVKSNSKDSKRKIQATASRIDAFV